MYEYPLSKAIEDGYTRTPFAVTRSDIDFYNFGDEALDKLMLTDGITCHENAKRKLELYAANSSTPDKPVRTVKPFMLVVCKDTAHAAWVEDYIRSDEFRDGAYRNKTIVVHSKQKGAESEANTRLLLDVESPDNPVEIVEEKGVSANDSLAHSNNAAIISVGYDASGMKYEPQFFYDDYTIVVPMNYYINNKKHFLSLMYYPNEDNGPELTLYLAHNSNKDSESANSTSWNLTANTGGYYGLGLFYKAYDLRSVISRYKRETGFFENPPVVKIVANVNQYSMKLDDSQTEEKTYTVTKKEADK